MTIKPSVLLDLRCMIPGCDHSGNFTGAAVGAALDHARCHKWLILKNGKDTICPCCADPDKIKKNECFQA